MLRSIITLWLCCLLLVPAVKAVAAESQLAQLPVLQLLTEHSPPGEYLDAQGELSGVTYQLLRDLADELQEPVQFQLLPWARAFSLATSQPSTGLFETTRTVQREALFQWVGPLKIHRLYLFARKDRFDPALPQQLWPQHYTACEYNKSAYLEKLAQLGFVQEPQLYRPMKQGDCFEMLMRQRVDLILLSDTSYAMRQPELAANQVELVKVAEFASTTQYLAFSLDVPARRVARWQQALMQSYRDGRMRQRYQGIYPEAMLEALEQFAQQQLPETN
ncbi:ABC transporter substrate-binding protein [Alishewanella sp. BS5-314]|uniref:substrate-binding periplasmic protein n=1 Tax=Alishewanella sp. BS5-314 TaxID=2755587 RepID=UPI0021BAB1DA|nr:ABC transporter substrate-binding protein [Alishewanella sp. BS5-314]MCT8125257.1 ABC transporter substrate-binding protein [Alishewanella sp. BS5-314]